MSDAISVCVNAIFASMAVIFPYAIHGLGTIGYVPGFCVFALPSQDLVLVFFLQKFLLIY